MTSPSGRREEPSSAEAKRNRQRAHQGGERSHDNRPKTFNARFVNGRATVVTFV